MIQFFIGTYFLQFNFCQNSHFPNWINFFNLQLKYSNVKMGAGRTAYVGIFYLFFSCDLKFFFLQFHIAGIKKNKIMCIKTLKSHLIIPRCSKTPMQFRKKCNFIAIILSVFWLLAGKKSLYIIQESFLYFLVHSKFVYHEVYETALTCEN